MNSLLGLSARQLRKAADLKEELDVLNAELASLLEGRARGDSAPSKPSSGKLSRSEAAKARWAKIRASKGGGTTTPNPSKQKRTMSAAGRAKIAAAAKARWAKVRAAKAGK